MSTALVQQTEDDEIEILSPSMQVVPMEAQARAEIDIQIATAKRYPRSIKRFLAQAETLATLNPEIARQCTYAKPVGGKTMIGPSVRLAEIVMSTWGNLSVGARVISEDSRFLTAQGVCIDYETNVRTSIEVRRRITEKSGRTYSDDNIANAANSACSIALRNAVFRIVPKSLVEQIRLRAVQVANGDSTIEQLRENWVGYWASKGVENKRVFAALGVAGKDDISLEHIEILSGLATSVKDREISLAEAFPEPAAIEASKPQGSKTDSLAASLKAANGKKETSREPGDD